MSEKTQEQVMLEMPKVSGEEAAEATDLVEHLLEKYKVNSVDADALFNAMVAVYIRNRIVYGDRKPDFCAAGALANALSEEKN